MIFFGKQEGRTILWRKGKSVRRFTIPTAVTTQAKHATAMTQRVILLVRFRDHGPDHGTEPI